jgi:hypothetical protein
VEEKERRIPQKQNWKESAFEFVEKEMGRKRKIEGEVERRTQQKTM